MPNRTIFKDVVSQSAFILTSFREAIPFSRNCRFP